MPWVTTTQRVRLPVFSDRAGQRWKEPWRELAAKLVHELQPTSYYGT